MNSQKDQNPPADYKETLDNLLQQKKSTGDKYKSMINDVNDFANGSLLGGARKEYFPEWKDEDFKDLLEDLGEKIVVKDLSAQDSNRPEHDVASFIPEGTYYYLIYSTSRVELIANFNAVHTE